MLENERRKRAAIQERGCLTENASFQGVGGVSKGKFLRQKDNCFNIIPIVNYLKVINQDKSCK